MAKAIQTTSIALQGSIAQVVEEGGKSVMKILVEPFYLTYQDGLMLHLGDKVEVKGQIAIQEIKQEFQSTGR